MSEVKEKLEEEQLVACAIHLYLRYIFNIGDSGMHNMLLCKREFMNLESAKEDAEESGVKEECKVEEEKEERKVNRVIGIDTEENRGDSDYFVKSSKEEKLLKPYLSRIPIITEFDPLSKEFMAAIKISEEGVLARSRRFVNIHMKL